MKAPSSECGCCGKRIAKAHRIFLGIVHCNACYVREFVVVACRQCHRPARVHKSVGHGLCRSCECLARRCVRCDGPVPRAALMTSQGAVCTKCRRYFEPLPKKAPRPDDHATCSVCRRHRKVAGYDGMERPVCNRCSADPQNKERADAERQSYWTARLIRQTALFKEGLEAPGWQDLFDRFVAARREQTDVVRLVLKLPTFLEAFRTLEGIAPDPASISPKLLLTKMTARELRRIELVVSFLHEAGFKIPSREQAINASEERRIQQALAEVSESRHAVALKKFVAEQRQVSGPRGSKKLTSVRLNVRVAVELAKHAGERKIDAPAIASFLKLHPGQRACLYAFVASLKREDPEVRMPAARGPGRSEHEGNSTSRSTANDYLINSESFADLRAAFAGWITATLGVPLLEVAKLERSSITFSRSGVVSLRLRDRVIRLPGNLDNAVRSYVSMRDQMVRDRSNHLFPGRPLHQAVTAETLRSRLVVNGIVPSVAGRAARAAIVDAVGSGGAPNGD